MLTDEFGLKRQLRHMQGKNNNNYNKNNNNDRGQPNAVHVTVYLMMWCLFVCFVAGKTTILYKFKLNETVPSIPTIGFNVETLTPVKGLTMTVWDMGGQERMRALWRMYLRGTDGESWL